MTNARRVLVTGSSRGIGRAIATALADAGWTPLIHARTQVELAEDLARAIGGVACPFGADLALAADCRRLFAWATGSGPLTALVNNAGIYLPGAFDGDDDDAFEESWRHHYETNFLSTLRMTRLFVRAATGGGRVLNVASRVGFRGEAGAAAYAASKAAQISLTRSLAVELAPRKIGVFGIAPGWVDTALSREGMSEQRAAIEATIPLGRMASPTDCAAAAVFLLGDSASYLSGHTIDINGASYFH